MAEQQKQKTKYFVVSEMVSENEFEWKKKFEESKATIADLEVKILRTSERKGVMEGKISSAINLMQGYLKGFPLTSETKGQFKSIIRVLELDADPVEFTSKAHGSQQTRTLDTSTGNMEKSKSSVQQNGNEDSSRTSIQMVAELFSKSLLNNLDDDTKAVIEKLCMRLKCDDVALKLAVSYINEDLLALGHPLKNAIEKYLVKIVKKDLRNSGKIPEIADNPSYQTWRLTTKKIRKTPKIGEKAIEVLNIISFLSSDNIPTQFVWDLYNSMENQDCSTIRDKMFQLLKRFSVIINSGSGESFSVHPLIQQASRNDLEEQEKFTEILRTIQSRSHEKIKENGVTSEQMIHFKSIWDHLTKRTDLIKEGSGFARSIFKGLMDLGKYREAYDFGCKVLPVLESNLGANDRCTLEIKSWKGGALGRLGEHSKSLELLTEVYEEQKEILGEEDEHCLETACEMGAVLCSLEKYDEAQKLLLNSLEKSGRVFGAEHLGTRNLKHNMALVLDGQGKYTEAMELFRQILEVEEREKENSETLTTKFSLATVRFYQGEYVDALKIFEEVLEGRERVLEVNHHFTLLTKEWIAATYIRLERNEEAVELYKDVLEKREKIFGPEHPDTLFIKHKLLACNSPSA